MKIPQNDKYTSLINLQNNINYKFNNLELLKLALTHRSFSSSNYERLEFIGDSILNYAVAIMLFQIQPKLNEGDLSRLRSSLVNQDTLANIAKEIGIDFALYLGPGEIRNGGNNRASILADSLEAIIAAISLDSSLNESMDIVKKFYDKKIKTIDIKSYGKDPKSLLQEILQAYKYELPHYDVVEAIGSAHEKTFVIECSLKELSFKCQARASSKKQAERKAAQIALDFINDHLD